MALLLNKLSHLNITAQEKKNVVFVTRRLFEISEGSEYFGENVFEYIYLIFRREGLIFIKL